MSFFRSNEALPPYIFKGYLREGQLATLSGYYNEGKTPLLSQIAAHTINGAPLFGCDISQRPVIDISFETPGATWRRNISNLSERMGFPLPNVPEQIECYLLYDNLPTNPTSEQIAMEELRQKFLAILGDDLEARLGWLASRLEEKPNALVIVDPLELLCPIDANKGSHMVNLFQEIRRIVLTPYPHAAMIASFNNRKPDRKVSREYDITTQDGLRTFLEETSGSGKILDRGDVRMGFHPYQKSDDIRVLNALRRGEEGRPIIMSKVPYGEEDGETIYAGFERHTPTAGEEYRDKAEHFTETEEKHWKRLPPDFTFREAVHDHGIPRSVFSRLKVKAVDLGLLEWDGNVWRKTNPKVVPV